MDLWAWIFLKLFEFEGEVKKENETTATRVCKKKNVSIKPFSFFRL